MGFLEEGKKIEQEFARDFEALGYIVRFADEKEDMEEHWDVMIMREGTWKVDVKDVKKINRSDTTPDQNYHWLEIKNVNGDLGWALSKKADVICFATNDLWIPVGTWRLKEYISEKVEKEYCDTPKLYKLYSRKGRDDLLTIVPTLDLMYLAIKSSPRPIPRG